MSSDEFKKEKIGLGMAIVNGNECSPCKACKNRKCKENFVRLFGIEIRISRIRKPIFHVRTDTEKSRS